MFSVLFFPILSLLSQDVCWWVEISESKSCLWGHKGLWNEQNVPCCEGLLSLTIGRFLSYIVLLYHKTVLCCLNNLTDLGLHCPYKPLHLSHAWIIAGKYKPDMMHKLIKQMAASFLMHRAITRDILFDYDCFNTHEKSANLYEMCRVKIMTFRHICFISIVALDQY